MKVQVGSMVKLRSSRLSMTVHRIDLTIPGGKECVECIWFTKDDRLERGQFYCDALDAYVGIEKTPPFNYNAYDWIKCTGIERG